MTKISIKPSEHSGEQQPLNLNDKKLMGSIHEHPLEWLVQNYISPPAEPNSYFDIRDTPSVWNDCVSKFPARHLFLYSFCLASVDKSLEDLKGARGVAINLCRQTGNEPGLTWLYRRPQYALRMDTLGDRKHYPAWSWEVKLQTTGLASGYGITGKLMLILYSSKVMLGSNVDLQEWRSVLEEEVRGWDSWVANEEAKIRELFNLASTK